MTAMKVASDPVPAVVGTATCGGIGELGVKTALSWSSNSPPSAIRIAVPLAVSMTLPPPTLMIWWHLVERRDDLGAAAVHALSDGPVDADLLNAFIGHQQRPGSAHLVQLGADAVDAVLGTDDLAGNLELEPLHHRHRGASLNG
jgi:hypothetical protein